jgi:hypothetical protein
VRIFAFLLPMTDFPKGAKISAIRMSIARGFLPRDPFRGGIS